MDLAVEDAPARLVCPRAALRGPPDGRRDLVHGVLVRAGAGRGDAAHAAEAHDGRAGRHEQVERLRVRGRGREHARDGAAASVAQLCGKRKGGARPRAGATLPVRAH